MIRSHGVPARLLACRDGQYVKLHKAFAAMLAIAGCLTLAACSQDQSADRNEETNIAQDLDSALGSLEERSYAAWKSGDTKFWSAFLSDKFVGWSRSGRLDKSAAERVMSGVDCQINSYRLIAKQVNQLTANAAVLTHRTEISGTCGSERLAPASYTATVYVREAGEWKAAFRTQSAITDPMKAVKPAAGDIWNGGPTSNDASTQTLLDREQAVWGAWKDRDTKRIDALLGDSIQFIDIFGNHLATRPETLKAWSGEGCDVKSFDISGAKATMFAPDFGILTVRATTDGKCFGQDVWPIWGTSLYVKNGDTWFWSFGINVLAGAGSN